MGSVQRMRGEYDRALDLYRQDLAIARGLDNKRSIGKVLNNIGLVHLSQSELDQALECYQQDLSISTELGISRVLHSRWVTSATYIAILESTNGHWSIMNGNSISATNLVILIAPP